MKNKHLSKLFYGIITILFIVVTSCNNSENSEIIQVNPKYAEFITAYTSGVISNKSEIIIELKNELSDDEINKINTNQLFDFEPKIAGKTEWINNRTIRFIPDSDLSSQVLYKVTFHLSKVSIVPSDMLDFVFQFQAKHMDMNVYIEGLTPYSDDLEWQKVGGFITTTDHVSEEIIKQLVTASQKKKKLNIRWVENKNVNAHSFVIDSISRGEKRGVLNILWDGNLIGVNKDGKIDYEIPPLGDFKVMDFNIGQLPDQFIKVRFSDPLSKNAILAGLARYSGLEISFVLIIRCFEPISFANCREACISRFGMLADCAVTPNTFSPRTS